MHFDRDEMDVHINMDFTTEKCINRILEVPKLMNLNFPTVISH
jgi:hypothetical protein